MRRYLTRVFRLTGRATGVQQANQRSVTSVPVNINVREVGPPADYSVDTIADMLAITGYSIGETVEVGGYWADNDGGGGTFEYMSSSEEPNIGTLFIPDDEPENIRLKRDVTGYDFINGLWCGITREDHPTQPADNDYNHVRIYDAAIIALNEMNGRLYLPPGVYRIRNRFSFTQEQNGLHIFSDPTETHIGDNPIYRENDDPESFLNRGHIFWSPRNDPEHPDYNKFRIHTPGTGAMIKRANTGYTNSGIQSRLMQITQTLELPPDELKLQFKFTNLVFDGNRAQVLADLGHSEELISQVNYLILLWASHHNTRLYAAKEIVFENCIFKECNRSAITSYLAKSPTEYGVFFYNHLSYNNCQHGLAVNGGMYVDGWESHNNGFDENIRNLKPGSARTYGGGGFSFDFSTHQNFGRNIYSHHNWQGMKTSVNATRNELVNYHAEYCFNQGLQHTGSAPLLERIWRNAKVFYCGNANVRDTSDGEDTYVTKLHTKGGDYHTTYGSNWAAINAVRMNAGLMIVEDYGVDEGGDADYSTRIHSRTQIGHLYSNNNSKKVQTFSAGHENRIFSANFNHTAGNALMMEGGGATILLLLHTNTNRSIVVGSGHTLKYGALTLTGGASITGTGTASQIMPTLPVPTLSSPNNNAVDVGLTPILSWSSVNGADKYVVQITDDNFNTVLWCKVTDSLSVEVDEDFLENEETYKWRVYAVKTSSPENFSNWSVVRSFVTGG